MNTSSKKILFFLIYAGNCDDVFQLKRVDDLMSSSKMLTLKEIKIIIMRRKSALINERKAFRGGESSFESFAK